MSDVVHRRLPDSGGAFLAGRGPLRDGHGLRTDGLQIWYARDVDDWTEDREHAHRQCDEVYVVLAGSLCVAVDGVERVVGPREYLCVPRGTFHRIVRAGAPAEVLVVRAPSVDDKVFRGE